MEQPPLTVGLFVTCLVDIYRPSVAFAAIELLEEAGCVVKVPHAQTCCGQPSFNSGDKQAAKKAALANMRLFRDVDYIVIPSGSCTGMIKKHYIELFEDDSSGRALIKDISERTYELTSFLDEVLGLTFEPQNGARPYKVTYHDSCAGLRELNIKKQPRQLLHSTERYDLTEMPTAETCCGFGGTFCVKYPQISTHMVENKSKDIEKSGADIIAGGDMGCLLNIAGYCKRNGIDIEVRHVAELLTGDLETPSIGEGA